MGGPYGRSERFGDERNPLPLPGQSVAWRLYQRSHPSSILPEITGPLQEPEWLLVYFINLLKPNDIYICRTKALTSRRYILNIYSTNIHTEYF